MSSTVDKIRDGVSLHKTKFMMVGVAVMSSVTTAIVGSIITGNPNIDNIHNLLSSLIGGDTNIDIDTLFKGYTPMDLPELTPIEALTHDLTTYSWVADKMHISEAANGISTPLDLGADIVDRFVDAGLTRDRVADVVVNAMKGIENTDLLFQKGLVTLPENSREEILRGVIEIVKDSNIPIERIIEDTCRDGGCAGTQAISVTEKGSELLSALNNTLLKHGI